MKMLLRLSGVCFVIVIAAAPPALSDQNMDAWKAVTAAYGRCDRAAAARDVAGTLGIDTARYQVVDARGKVLYSNGPEMVKKYGETYAAATQVRQHTNLQKLTLKSGVAKATVLQRLQLSSIDPNINNWRTWVIDWKMEDIWISTGGIWKRKRTVMLNQTSVKRVGPVS